MAYKSAFDPENDPVVYTTDYGLEIRYSNALTNAALSGYSYFSVGGYNWVIIGYDPSMYECVQDVSGEAFRDNPIEGGNFMTQFETVDNSAAGSAIMRDNFAISTLAVPNFEIGEGCVLCLCEIYIGTTTFNPSNSYGNNYKGSNLQNYINKTIYEGTSALSVALRSLPIKQQELKTFYYDGSEHIVDHSEYIFPLATADNASNLQNFCIETYLPLESLRLMPNATYGYWLRCGRKDYIDRSAFVYTTGIFWGGSGLNNSIGVRPAFVLQL